MEDAMTPQGYEDHIDRPLGFTSCATGDLAESSSPRPPPSRLTVSYPFPGMCTLVMIYLDRGLDVFIIADVRTLFAIRTTTGSLERFRGLRSRR